MQSSQLHTSFESECAYLQRIDSALEAASRVAQRLFSLRAATQGYADNEPVTIADSEINRVLRQQLQRPNEGWLSEEDPDDLSRMSYGAVWFVDPLDGTREFMDGLPEWSISVGLIMNGLAIAGGITRPSTGDTFLGSRSTGVTQNKRPTTISDRTTLEGATVLASRQEYLRGEWQRFEQQPFCVRPVGSIALKLALVATGFADATWTLQPKHSWDIAAGVALVIAAGGRTCCMRDVDPRFNCESTLHPGLIASGSGIWDQLTQLIDYSQSIAKAANAIPTR